MNCNLILCILRTVYFVKILFFSLPIFNWVKYKKSISFECVLVCLIAFRKCKLFRSHFQDETLQLPIFRLQKNPPTVEME